MDEAMELPGQRVPKKTLAVRVSIGEYSGPTKAERGVDIDVDGSAYLTAGMLALWVDQAIDLISGEIRASVPTHEK